MGHCFSTPAESPMHGDRTRWDQPQSVPTKRLIEATTGARNSQATVTSKAVRREFILKDKGMGKKKSSPLLILAGVNRE